MKIEITDVNLLLRGIDSFNLSAIFNAVLKKFLEMKNHRKVVQCVRGHVANKCQSQHLNLDCLTPEPLFFTTPSTDFQEDFASLTYW